MPNENLTPQTDLNDPATLLRELDAAVGGLEIQATHAEGSSAGGGVSYPEQFYRRVARACAAARDRLKATVPDNGTTDGGMGSAAGTDPVGGKPKEKAK